MVWKTHEQTQRGERGPKISRSRNVLCDRITIVSKLQTSNDMVEEESSGSFCNVIERRHGLFPFGKVIDHDDDVIVIIVGGWSTLHEVNAPLAKGVDHDDLMESSEWCTSFGYVNLIIYTMFDSNDTVVKE